MQEVTEAIQHPLTLPEPLWESLAPERQKVYERAQTLLERLPDRGAVELPEILSGSGIAFPDALLALSLLDSMNLVAVEPGAQGPRVSVVARPDEHVHFVGPDGKDHWVFVARPLNPPDLDANELN